VIPTWFKFAYSAFVLLVVVIWLRYYGWRNFLWFSDIAFIGAVPAMWLESSWLASTLTVAVLIPELLWNVDYLLRLILRRRITGLTEYMFEPQRPLILRTLSLFHVPLPLVLLWMLAAWGYRNSALTGATVLALFVLPASRLVSTPAANINWTYGLSRTQELFSPPVYVALLFAAFVVLLFLPTHLILSRMFI